MQHACTGVIVGCHVSVYAVVSFTLKVRKAGRGESLGNLGFKLFFLV